mmetsp:Transcript_8325/g.27725  ORF Transcript_8325/g.27725 Transcript_8325/m.27725 type:complete len:242 (+) Transcript_8325:133-858(+)
MNAYAIVNSTHAAAIWYSYTFKRVAFLIRSTTAATPPIDNGISTKKLNPATKRCRPCPEKTPPVHSEFRTPSNVATTAAGNTLDAFVTTTLSLVVKPTTWCVNGRVSAMTVTSVKNTTPVASQKLRRAASPSPLPRWYPTRTAITMENMALIAPAHITVAVDTAVVAATASVPNLLTNNVVACETVAENTSVPTKGTPCFRNSQVTALGWCFRTYDFKPLTPPVSGQNPTCAFLSWNMYTQ